MMILRKQLVRTMLFAGLGFAAFGDAAANIQLVSVRPTVLFPNRVPLCQVAWVDVVNPSSQPILGNWIVSVDGVPGALQKDVIQAGASRRNVLVPDLQKPAEVKVVWRTEEGSDVELTQSWQPQRKWTVYVVKSSHEDIGYESFLWLKQKEIADFIDIGNRLSTPGANVVEAGAQLPGGYHYTLETLLFPRYYMEERSERALRGLLNEGVKTGRLPLNGAPNGIHTDWLDYEELARTAYPARREYRDRFGLEIDTINIVDNPSMSWSACQAWADAGFKYAVRYGQPFRTAGHNDYASTKLPAVFWWEAPDGHSKILYSWRNHYGINFWFGQVTGGYADLSELAATNIQDELMAVQSGEKLGPYPYDALLVPSYGDHEIPTWDNRALQHWASLYRYPAIKISGPRSFMTYVESKFAPQIPTLRGELNNFSGDYATIDPEAQALKRSASRLLPEAEGWGTLAEAIDPSFSLPTKDVEGAYQHMFDFDEHSWPTSPPVRDVHQFNAQWGKHLEGERAWTESSRLLGEALDAIGREISTGKSNEVVVYNSLAHARTDVVSLKGEILGLVDLETNRVAPVQHKGDTTFFIAENVPAFGYKRFRVEGQPGSLEAKQLTAESAHLENQFYSIAFSPSSGAVLSISDKVLNRELVDRTAPYEFNQLVWDHKDGRESKTGTDYAPRTGASLSTEIGPVFAEMTSKIKDRSLGDAVLTQVVRLYVGLKRIEISNEIQHIGVMHSTRTADRYRNNIFYAFPTKVDGFTARAEYPGGVVRPYDDQLRWGSHDFLAANRWVDVSNQDFGITMGLGNAPIVDFGEIRYNEFSIDYKPKVSHLYSYAWSNRMDGLYTLSASDMNAKFSYAFMSHSGDWNKGNTTTFGWSYATPMLARLLPALQKGPLGLPAQSFVQIDAANVQLTVLKPSNEPGRGWVVRLVETEGRATEAKLKLHGLPAEAATLCDLVENDQHPLALSAGEVAVSLPAFGFATIRLSSVPSIGYVTDVVSSEVTNASVRLRWTAPGGASVYNVFRSMDPDEPPTAYDWVGRAGTNTFVDHGLNAASTYHYRVAGVGPANFQGTASKASTVNTSEVLRAAPVPVKELGIVRLSGDSLMVAWHRNPEPTVARYLLFRSERPDFETSKMAPIAVVTPGGYYLEHFTDKGLKPGTRYYYKVSPEDWCGNRQMQSPEASGITPLP